MTPFMASKIGCKSIDASNDGNYMNGIANNDNKSDIVCIPVQYLNELIPF